MRPKVGIVSVGLTSRAIANVLREMDLPADVEFLELLLREDSLLHNEIDAYDVLLSSGNNAKILKQKCEKPVITISPSLYDILQACSKSLEYARTPAVIMHRDAYPPNDLRRLSNLLLVDIVFKSYDRTDAGIEEIILELKRQGHTCIIGSGLVCEYAGKNGMHSIYLFPDESIRTSLRTAADLAASICQKNIQNLRLASIIRNSQRGIMLVSVDQTILICNPIAAKFFQVDEKDMVGRRLADFFSAASIERITASADTTRFFKKLGDITYVVDAIPIMARGEVTERLIYLDDLKDIQKTDHDFRRKIWAENGFLAKYTFDEYRSVNREFQDFLSIAKSFAKTEEPVVILGETGSGKEFLAQSIHNHSNRAGKAFVAVNCAAIPENLLESELFGYNEGAFTGAKKGGKEGYFEMAHMGTIFLDEIAEMSSMLQSKLLRVIQEKQVLRVGGTKLIPFNARVVVATNKNLWSLLQDNKFRKDLYYRLNVLELEIPPLRQRPDDIMLLFENFVRQLSPAMWDSITLVVKGLEDTLAAYPWPGNVRELENFVHMLIAHWQPGENPENTLALIINLLERKRQRTNPTEPPSAAAPAARQLSGTAAGLLKNAEERQIREAIAVCRGNVIRAAEILGIHRTTLWRKLKRLERVAE
jgi:propionate catabolism operon transcriptional regulator